MIRNIGMVGSGNERTTREMAVAITASMLTMKILLSIDVKRNN